MTPQRWSRIREVFGSALEMAQSERPRFLDSACGQDMELRVEVERLLAGNEEPSWESPANTLLALNTEFNSGDTVAQYRIDSRLGEGGMGVVYKAYDTRLHRNVALKVLTHGQLDDSEHKRRIMREARAASALNHPNIVTVYEIGSEGDVDFIAMEYVDGHSLACAIPEEGLPLGTALGYASGIATALTKAHAAGVIHRDLKPANIMLTSENNIKLLDFGLAWRDPVPKPGTALTAEGEISGTVGYMSPEQIRGLPVDHRTDLFSFGVVFYEMIIGQRPFTGTSAAEVCQAILYSTPRDFGQRTVPGGLKAVILKLLEKEAANRYRTATAVQEELKTLENSLGTNELKKPSRSTWMAIAAMAVLIALSAGWFWRGWSRERWAFEMALPEITRFIDAGEYVKAAAVAQRARAVLPKNQTLETFWKRATGEVSIDSVPSHAEVSIRPYRGNGMAWEALGKTPLQKIRLPPDTYLWRVTKAGFAPVFFIGQPRGAVPPGYQQSQFNRRVNLRPEANVPSDMVVVAGGDVGLSYPLNEAPFTEISDFLIDRHEVTNEEYKKFVDAGGYQRREFWKHLFVRDGRSISWHDSMAFFHDATGHLGPSTWEGGSFQKGRDKYPVAGVSWYEAAAYAEFVGKSLPTAYHWTLASQSPVYTPVITPGSNFGREGTQPVGSDSALSGFGTTDMAGNVKEWCLNETRDGKRLILGGGFGEPNYMFNFTDAQSAWDRRSNFGFRCAKLDSPATPIAAGRIEVTTRDYWKEKPISEEVFNAYTALYSYDRVGLNAQIEETAAMDDWSRVRVTFDAAYGHERVTAYVFLPKKSHPPFQTVVYFPGGFAFLDDKLDLGSFEETRGFLLKSGRALVFPIYKGTYERRDGYVPGGSGGFHRDHAIAWAKDLSRTLDYIDTRNDLDKTKVAYLGDSAGAAQAAILLAVEKRIKTGILASGGFHFRHFFPEADPINFITHVTIPVLMLNGRYDGSFPVESSQRPFFHLLGTNATNKKHVIYEGGHAAFLRPEGNRECLDWLDKYLGPVK